MLRSRLAVLCGIVAGFAFLMFIFGLWDSGLAIVGAGVATVICTLLLLAEAGGDGRACRCRARPESDAG